MSVIDLHLIAQNKELTLKITEVTADEKLAVIDHAFAAFGVTAPAQSSRAIAENQKHERNKSGNISEVKSSTSTERTSTANNSFSHFFSGKDPALNKPTVPPVTDTEVAMLRGQLPANVPPVLARHKEKFGEGNNGEVMQESASTREKGKLIDPNYEQGYQIKDGDRKLYRAGYDCPKCADEGYRYVDPKHEYTKCRCCNTKIALTPAHPDGFPNRDEESGDYFYGNMEYPD